MAYKLSQRKIKEVVQKGAQALADYCEQNNIHYVVTGVSGGLDSAVILAFAEKAGRIAAEQGFELTSVGVIMPCESNPEAKELAEEAIEKFNARKICHDLTEIMHLLRKMVIDSAVTDPMRHGLDPQIYNILETTGNKPAQEEDWSNSRKVALGNIKARLRMIRMMKGIVLSTDNLSEYWMGFWTLHGDVGDFGIIQQILKGLELYDIAHYLKVPPKIIDAKPDDGLGVTTGGDAGQLGAEYDEIDPIIGGLIQ